jgi:tetratricopeptide (TPR) repeat protein
VKQRLFADVSRLVPRQRSAMTEISLENAQRRYAILLAAFVIFAIVVFHASRLWIARHRVDSNQIEIMERGAALVPDDAESWERLGQRQLWDLANPDPGLALRDFQNAVKADPLTARYWVDLAGALEVPGDTAGAEKAYEQAHAVYPRSADVAFGYGNFLLRQENFAKAYPQLRLAAQEDPKLLPLILSRTARATDDTRALLDDVLPHTVDAYLQALTFFSVGHQVDAALDAWSRVLARHEKVPLQGTFPFFDELIRENRSDDAKRAWREAIVASGVPFDEDSNGSLVWNGKFKESFLNGGLDWRWEPQPNVAIDFDSAAAPAGSRALRFDFGGGANLGLASPEQFVPVVPGRPYHFHAYMRTDQITTESGLRFSVTDASHAVNVLTDNFVGSHPWTPLEADFTAGPATSFIDIRLVREPSRLFENKLAGTVWIADVSLIPNNAPREKSGK